MKLISFSPRTFKACLISSSLSFPRIDRFIGTASRNLFITEAEIIFADPSVLCHFPSYCGILYEEVHDLSLRGQPHGRANVEGHHSILCFCSGTWNRLSFFNLSTSYGELFDCRRSRRFIAWTRFSRNSRLTSPSSSAIPPSVSSFWRRRSLSWASAAFTSTRKWLRVTGTGYFTTFEMVRSYFLFVEDIYELAILDQIFRPVPQSGLLRSLYSRNWHPSCQCRY